MFDEIKKILLEVGSKLLSMRALGPIKGTWYETQLKSEADLVAENIIINKLQVLTPDLQIVSEEDNKSHLVDRFARYWLVDPIDGTASFCEGFSGFVTQIALMEYSQPILSAVYAPVSNKMYLAKKGANASVNGDTLLIKPQHNEIILTDNYPEPKGVANLLYNKLPCTDYLESGSIGLKICKVADGEADLFVKDVLVRDWDLAPGQLILQEAGGSLRDLKGMEINYSGDMEQKSGLIAATSEDLILKVSNLVSEEKFNLKK